VGEKSGVIFSQLGKLPGFLIALGAKKEVEAHTSSALKA